LKPDGFTSDGCTGFVQVWRSIDLSACCTAHDLAWYLNPGDWWAWLVSNISLAACFATAGAWELVAPAFVAVSTIGALLFFRKKPRQNPPDKPNPKV
jgi:hypothetical protein